MILPPLACIERRGNGMIFLIIYFGFIDDAREPLTSFQSIVFSVHLIKRLPTLGNMKTPRFQSTSCPHMFLNLTKNASFDALR